MDPDRVEAYRLSPQQARLFALGPDARRPHCIAAFTGPPDPSRLEAAVRTVMARHEIFRTRVRWIAGIDEPVQTVDAEGALFFECCGTDDQATAFDTCAARVPLEIPLAVCLARSGSQHLMWISMAPTCGDGAALRNVIAEIDAVFRGECLPPPQVQYPDAAEWANRVFEEDERGRAYWAAQSSAGEIDLRLPFERPCRHQRSRWLSVISQADTTRGYVASLADACVAPESTVLLAVWIALIHRMAGRSVPVGVQLDGRCEEALRTAPGLFARVVPVSVDLNPDSTMAETIARVRERLAGAALHQYQFDSRSLGHRLFGVGFDCSDLSGDAGEGHALTVIDQSPPGEPSHLHLSLALSRVGMRVALHVDAQRYDGSVASSLRHAFIALLESACLNPSRPIRSLDLVSRHERHQQLVAWNDTGLTYDTTGLLHVLIERQIASTPDRVAVTCGRKSLTYRELGARANRLARELRRLGVRRDVCVGICADRSLELMIGLLAVLKAGGAYVPLDPGYPPDRTRFMLQDTGARVLLVQGRSVAQWTGEEASIVPLDVTPEPVTAADEENLDMPADPADLAYVIYTSGSTGRPKGVAISHGAIVNRLLWMQYDLPIGAADVVLQKTPTGFDASVWELFVPLIAGSRLACAEPGGHQDSRYLVDAVLAEGVTTLQLVPSMLGAVLQEPAMGRCSSLRRVYCGGEPLHHQQVREFFRVLDCELHNLYGPTEVSIDATHWRVERQAEVIAIGRPLRNVRVYILKDFQPVPVGLEGDLYVGGAGLARGYVGRPDLTAERFVPDPFSASGGERLYRTGDRARYLSDGSIEYCGRSDRQIKLRGFRIELGEIESVVANHPQIREAVVVCDESGDVRLAAYVVARQAADEDHVSLVSSLNALLTSTLPAHMVPSTVVVLDSLPRLPNGKLDRSALATLRADPRQEEQPPRWLTPTEEMLAAMWAELIPGVRPAAEADFFAVGGHSLLAIKLVARIRDAFNVELPVRTLFEHSTLSAMAARVDEVRRSTSAGPSTPLVAAARTGSMPLSLAQGRLWVLNQLDPLSPAYNLPSAIRLKGPLDIGAMEQALSEVVARHEILRTRFTATDEGPVQTIAAAAAPPRLPVVDLTTSSRADAEAEAQRLVRAEGTTPFDLTVGPLLRAQLIRLAPEEHVALFTMHHIVSDGWSMGIVVREVSAVYEALVGGRPSPLAHLALQYGDYTLWQRAWADGGGLEQHLGYWKQQLAGGAVLELPVDHQRPAAPSWRGVERRVRIPQRVVTELRQVCREERATLFMGLLAVFVALLHRYSQQHDITVGTPVANRHSTAVESLIGFFANTLPLRVDLAGGPTFRELLRRVRATALDAYAHQEVPFERIVEELQPERDHSRNPLFQVLFALQNASEERLRLPGVQTAAERFGAEATRFDLECHVVQVEAGLEIAVIGSCDLFDATTIERMVHHYDTILAAAASTPADRLSTLPLVPEGERRAIDAWSAGPPAADEDVDVTALIIAQAQRRPDAIAVSYGSRHCTYAELDRRVDRLAHRLVSEGVGLEDVVGVLSRRTPDLLIAMLAIFRSGAAYLPIDPALPAARIRSVARQSGCRLVLAAADCADRFTPETAGDPAPPVLVLGEHLEGHDAAPSCAKPVLPGQLAYVIYTSGSTGAPKGAMITHAGLTNHLRAKQESLALTNADVVAQTASPCFDISIWQYLAPLLAGGRVSVLDDDAVRDPGRLRDAVEGLGVSVLEIVPSMLRAWLDDEDVAARIAHVRALRWLVVTGEACPTALATHWLRLHPAPVVNAYGPTECSDDVTQHVLTAECEDDPRTVPIGSPIRSTNVYVLDGEMQPVPPGVPGELFIGGAGVGRGYRGAPASTALSFVPNPFSRLAGARLYRTGDLVRWRPHGVLEFLARIDDQVKIRGFRIEPGEIEALLQREPAIRDAVVAVRPGPTGDPRLVAYVTLRPSAVQDVSKVRAGLAERLPAYMLPSAVVVLDSLPLTANGKVDRRALPPPRHDETQSRFVPPATSDQKELERIWCDLLGIERAGMHDNFFALGGHSLLATQLASRIRRRFGVEVTLRTVFESQTIATLDAAMQLLRGQRMQAPESIRTARSSSEKLSDVLSQLDAMSDDEVARALQSL